jgi:hypothetical protein
VRFQAGEIIEFDDLMPVGRVGELQAEHIRVFPGLLQAISGGFPGGLGFDDGQRKIALEAQQVIHAAGRFADKALADGHDAAVGNGALFGDGMGFGVPARSLQHRDNEFSAGISFGQRHWPPMAIPQWVVPVAFKGCAASGSRAGIEPGRYSEDVFL